MQGNIWFESPGLGQGSSFFVELPVYGRDALLGSGAEEPLSRENEMDRMPRNTESRQRRLSTSIRVVVRRPSVPIRQRLITPNSSIRVGVTDDEESEAPPSSPRASILPKVDSKILFRETSAIISFEGRNKYETYSAK